MPPDRAAKAIALTQGKVLTISGDEGSGSINPGSNGNGGGESAQMPLRAKVILTLDVITLALAVLALRYFFWSV